MRYLTLPATVLVTGLLLAAPPKVVEEFNGKVIGVTDDHFNPLWRLPIFAEKTT